MVAPLSIIPVACWMLSLPAANTSDDADSDSATVGVTSSSCRPICLFTVAVWDVMMLCGYWISDRPVALAGK